jgi:DNA repair exonuclease SbcCD nuclease subunit
MPIKILHTADIHLGLQFRNHPEAQETLLIARYETLQNIVNLLIN